MKRLLLLLVLILGATSCASDLPVEKDKAEKLFIDHIDTPNIVEVKYKGAILYCVTSSDVFDNAPNCDFEAFYKLHPSLIYKSADYQGS